MSVSLGSTKPLSGDPTAPNESLRNFVETTLFLHACQTLETHLRELCKLPHFKGRTDRRVQLEGDIGRQGSQVPWLGCLPPEAAAEAAELDRNLGP